MKVGCVVHRVGALHRDDTRGGKKNDDGGLPWPNDGRAERFFVGLSVDG